MFDFEEEVMVHTDASDYAIGAEISQLDDKGKIRQVLFYSRRLNPAEERYSTVDKEMLAIVQTLKKFPHRLRGTKYPVVIKTDHKNLASFTTNKQLNGRQARWAEELAAYNVVREHIPGKQNIVADTLSRNPDYDTGLKTVELKEENGKLLLNQQARIAIMQVSCEDQRLLEETEKKAGDGRMEKFNGLIKVPKSMENQILKRYHDYIREGHPGLARIMEKVQRNFYTQVILMSKV